MAATAATAICGRRARVQSRVRALPRGIWRLLVLLGLAFVGCLLLGTTAYASDTPAPSPVTATPAPAGPAGPAAPVLDEVLDTTDALVPALPIRDIVGGVTKPVTSGGLPVDATTVAEIPAAAAPAVEPVAPTAVDALETLEVTDPVSKATNATAGQVAVHAPELPELPHLTDVVAPVITGTTSQLRSAVSATADLVDQVAAPIPLVGSVTQQAGSATRDAVERTTSLVEVTAYAAAGGVDAIVGQAVPALSPVLSPVLQTLTTLGQLGVAGSSPATSGVQGVPGYGSDIAGSPATTVAAPVAWADLVLTSQSENGPGVPPPDANASSSVQSASAIDTTLPVPVSDAGSTVVGSGSGTGSAGGSDLAKVLVERLSRRSAPSFAPKTEAPVRPMPGTPLADPGFSPD